MLRPASACAVHRRMLIERSLQVSLLSSGASGCRHRPTTHPAIRYSPARYSATLPAGNGAGRRRARGSALRRWARSKHARLGCRYAPRPGSRMVTSGTISSPAATRRTKFGLAARSPHPMQVRTGTACLASSLQGLGVSATCCGVTVCRAAESSAIRRRATRTSATSCRGTGRGGSRRTAGTRAGTLSS